LFGSKLAESREAEAGRRLLARGHCIWFTFRDSSDCLACRSAWSSRAWAPPSSSAGTGPASCLISWLDRHGPRPGLAEQEAQIEEAAGGYFGAMPFLWLAVEQRGRPRLRRGFRKAAMTRGPLAVRTWERSSS
jgi:hypothetical protein